MEVLAVCRYRVELPVRSGRGSKTWMEQHSNQEGLSSALPPPMVILCEVEFGFKV